MNLSIGNFLLGLLVAGIGALFVKFAQNLDNFFHLSFFQRHLGSGTKGYKIVGLLLIFFSALVMFGFVDLAGSVGTGESADSEPPKSNSIPSSR